MHPLAGPALFLTFAGILRASGGTSAQKLELLVAGASDLSARVKNLIACLGNYELTMFLYQHMLLMHVWPSDS